MLAITVRFHIEPLHEEAFFERVQRQATDTLEREPACRQFDVCRNLQNSREVFLYEIYDDDAAFTTHLKTPHFVAFDADVKGMVQHKVVEKWDKV